MDKWEKFKEVLEFSIEAVNRKNNKEPSEKLNLQLDTLQRVLNVMKRLENREMETGGLNK